MTGSPVFSRNRPGHPQTQAAIVRRDCPQILCEAHSPGCYLPMEMRYLLTPPHGVIQLFPSPWARPTRSYNFFPGHGQVRTGSYNFSQRHLQVPTRSGSLVRGRYLFCIADAVEKVGEALSLSLYIICVASRQGLPRRIGLSGVGPLASDQNPLLVAIEQNGDVVRFGIDG